LYQYNQAAADMLKKFDEQIAGIRAKKPVQDFVAVLTEVPGNIPATHVFYRGDHRDPRDEVGPGGLSITEDGGTAVEFPADDPGLPTSGRRLAFARWLTNPNNPLVSRALVNRIWMHHFGRPLVNTPGEFGRLGETPSHPELLDWLAAEFVQSGWNFKHLHRLIVTSTVYRQLEFPLLEETDSTPRRRDHPRPHSRDRRFAPRYVVRSAGCHRRERSRAGERRARSTAEHLRPGAANAAGVDPARLRCAANGDELRTKNFVDRCHAIADADEQRLRD
jgi:hypothetical protein